jgi:hypothetical protein
MYQVTEKSTTFGFKTKFGFKTPFKYPSKNGVSFTNLLSDLVVQLYPTGKAFNMLRFGIMDKFHTALNISFVRFFQDCQSTIDSCFPDSENFNEDDCSLWEYRFGMKTNLLLNVQTRREAIFRRMSRGRNIKARQHIAYIQYQLQQAGFNVYVYENGFIESGVLVYKRPEEVLALQSSQLQHGGSSQHGLGSQHGSLDSDIIANSQEPNESFSVGDSSLWASFFIGGSTLGTMATIPQIRQEEFRELVLKLKPAHLVAFTFISYV